jgi:murein DD-endopeptidase MepM/ murein hydrolase activator NlpD
MYNIDCLLLFMHKLKSITASFVSDVEEFLSEFGGYLINKFQLSFLKFETGKGVFVTALYRQRGKYARKFMHSGMAGLAAFGMSIAPIVAQEFPGREVDPWAAGSTVAVLSATSEQIETTTKYSDKIRDKIYEHAVQSGDTVSSIAEKYGVSADTVRWQNNIDAKDTIKPGQVLEIIPVTGIAHKVQKGDTVYSIAKKYDTEPQPIADFPFNAFVNDETFELAIGQIVIVPEGVKPQEKKPVVPRQQRTVPIAGTAVASGSFVWPTSGRITQGFSWYHKAWDIANRDAPNILAADGGTVVTAGWSGVGYGNHIIIDHGNGYRTLYAHMSSLYVGVGAKVGRGTAIGKMGSTGRSTGIHLHFEVIRNGVHLNPGSVLQ